MGNSIQNTYLYSVREIRINKGRSIHLTLRENFKQYVKKRDRFMGRINC